MKKLILILIVGLIVPFTSNETNTIKGLPTVIISSYRNFSINDSLDIIPEDYLLAMVAIHEAVNLCSLEECSLIMQSTWNRAICNWNNHGNSILEQIKSTEFKGLLDKNFKFNSSNPKHIECLKISRSIIQGKNFHINFILFL